MASKYNAKKAMVDGIKFDSQKEAKRYLQLRDLEKIGKICNLQLQVPFELVKKQPEWKERAVVYRADFVYIDLRGDMPLKVIEDVKGMRTREYVIKRKLMRLLYCKPDEVIFKEV